MLKLLILVAALGLAGCAGNVSHTWDRPYSTVDDLQRDDARCRNEGMIVAGINSRAPAIAAYRNCMWASGWTLEGVS